METTGVPHISPAKQQVICLGSQVPAGSSSKAGTREGTGTVPCHILTLLCSSQSVPGSHRDGVEKIFPRWKSVLLLGTEWRPLIGPDLLRSCALIGWGLGVAYAIKTQLKAPKAPFRCVFTVSKWLPCRERICYIMIPPLIDSFSACPTYHRVFMSISDLDCSTLFPGVCGPL